MMSKVYGFFGNEYLIQEKASLWKKRFQEKYGNGFNLISLRYETEADAEKILQEIEGMPLLSPNKMVFIYGLLDTVGSDAAEENRKEILDRVQQACADAAETYLIILVSPKPDRRRSFYKALLPENVRDIQLSKNLAVTGFEEGNKTVPLLEILSRRFGQNIPKDVLQYLLSVLAFDATESTVDLFFIQHEIEKLTSYSLGRPITKEDVDTVVMPAFATKIFDFGEAVGKGQETEAIDILEYLLSQGEDIYSLWNFLIGHFRRLLMLRVMIEESKGTEKIRAYLGKQAWKADDMIRQAKAFSLAKLQSMQQMFLEIDRRLKTGEITTTTTDSVSFQFAMEKLIFRAASKGN